jgi:hypothetical protein
MADRRAGVFVKLDKYGVQYATASLLMVLNPATGSSSAILHLLSRSNLNRIRKRLSEVPENFLRSPLTLLSILIQERTTRTNVAQRLVTMRDRLYQLEHLLGTHQNYLQPESDPKAGFQALGMEVWEREGFDSASGELTSLASDCLMYEAEIKTNIKAVEFLRKAHQLYESKRRSLAQSPTNDDYECLTSEIECLTDVLHTVGHRCKYLYKRSDLQVQAVSGSSLALAYIQ